jgi:hypothetical protein
VAYAYPSPDRESQGKGAKKQRPAAASSMTGCIDQKDGRYVLTNDQTLETIANLEAEGFPQEGFAKHVGQKVTVRGSSSSSGGLPVMKVRSIAVVSDICAPSR